MNQTEGINIICEIIVPITVPKARNTAIEQTSENGLFPSIALSVITAIVGSTSKLKRIVATPFMTEDKSVTPLASGYAKLANVAAKTPTVWNEITIIFAIKKFRGIDFISESLTPINEGILKH